MSTTRPDGSSALAGLIAGAGNKLTDTLNTLAETATPEALVLALLESGNG